MFVMALTILGYWTHRIIDHKGMGSLTRIVWQEGTYCNRLE